MHPSPAASGSIQKALIENVIEEFKKENKLRRRNIHIRVAPNKENVVVYTQRLFLHDTLGKEKPVIDIKPNYFPDDVNVLDPRYNDLGQKIKEYLSSISNYLNALRNRNLE